MPFLAHETSGLLYHTSTVLEDPGLVHAFTTRLGGVSQGHLSSLNLRSSVDPLARENYLRLCAALDASPDRLVLSKQVHEDTVLSVTAADAGKGFSCPSDYTADALVTNVPGLNLMVFSADCIILLLWDPVSRSIGAVHAGWRGAALDLPAKAVREMGRLFGAKPADIRAAIGAGIGPCCFETHDDVPDAMRAAFGPGAEAYIAPRGEKWTVDLKALNAWRLREAGLVRIDICPLCTACRPDLYWSHRRTGDRRGVQGALIGMREEHP